MNTLQAIIIAIIEGLTEFLPVSSTGHMILASSIMQIHEDEFVKTFEIAIQIGAILSVLSIYYKRFLVSIDIYLKLFVAFLPTGVIGFLAYKTIKTYLFNPIVVSAMLIIGGVVLIFLDRWTEKKQSKYLELEHVSYRDAFKIGLIQCLSMIPGVSRSAATIFGGIASGFDRRQAAEFSFHLAIPTMIAATGYDLLKSSSAMTKNEWMLLGIGLIMAFLSALVAVKAFVAFLNRYGFKYFGYYRIVLGVLFLLLVWQLDIQF
ncbi:MAG: undecaprenyl-diphosphate phosphatase [Flavobacteriales bacterium]